MNPAEKRGDGSSHAPVASVVVVTHDSLHALERSLPPLVAELRDDDELIVVDNLSRDGTPEAVRRLAPGARVIESEINLGYGGGCNAGAALAGGELLIFLNPDATVQPGFRAAIERPLGRPTNWGAWQGLVTSEDGTRLNSVGGVVHFTGIAWAGGAGQKLPSPTTRTEPGEVAFASGACLAIPRARWQAMGGFPAEFFLYHEDVDLSLRLRLAGHRVGIEPGAVVDHDYEFEKGPAKWRHLERNRWATIIRTYPTELILILAPALLVTELALVLVALAGGWLPQKLRAWVDVVRAAPGLWSSRRRVQAGRQASASEFAGALTDELDSVFLGRVGRSRLVGHLLRAYWLGAQLLLGRSSGR